MKLPTNIGMKARPKLMAMAGFTLGEMLIAVAVFSLGCGFIRWRRPS